MKVRRITEITLETAATLTIRWRADSHHEHSDEIRCPRCGSQAAVLARHEAAAFQAGLREVCGDAGLERVHIAQSEDGADVVCLESLRRAVPQLPGKSILQINQDKERPQ